MARPLRDGLDYFSLDVGFLADKKFKLIKAEFGAKGIVIALQTICEIYADKGYYKTWDKDDCYLMSSDIGCDCSPELVQNVILGCVQRGIFDKVVFDSFAVLTSAGIQRRYIRSTYKRDTIEIIKEICLLNLENRKDVPERIYSKITLKGINGDKTINNPVKTINNPDNSIPSTQSKVKESKVKESKVVSSTAAAKKAVILDKNINNYAVKDIVNLCAEISPVLYQRHTAKPTSDYALANILDELQLQYSLTDIKKLLEHTKKTFHSLPKYSRCDLVYVLSNFQSVLETEEKTTETTGVEKQRNDFLLSSDRTYTDEQIANLYEKLE